MKRNQFKYICNVCNVYSLLLYLLYKHQDEIDTTFFVFNASIPEVIRRSFINSYTMPNYHNYNWLKRIGIILFGPIIFRYIKRFKIPNFDNSEIYGTDFSRYDSILIGKKQYYCIEDCPNGFEKTYLNHYRELEKHKYKNKLRYYVQKLINGSLYCHRFGNNNQCIGCLTTTDVPNYLLDKTIIYISIKNAWITSSIAKRELILKIFGIDETIMTYLFEKKVIIFTQPLWPDFITFEEHKKIYSHILSQYDIADVLIKTHPRDVFDYSLLDSNVCILNKPIPFQILSVLGGQYKIAATVFSTAVHVLKDSGTKIDWYGTEIFDELFQAVGSKPI